MNPPFSNERLRNLSTEYDREQEEKYVTYWVNLFQKQVIEAAVDYSRKKMGGSEHNGYIGMFMFKQTIPKHTHDHSSAPKLNGIKLFANYLPRILERLIFIFPQMRIQVDPLQTYILFDWS